MGSTSEPMDAEDAPKEDKTVKLEPQDHSSLSVVAQLNAAGPKDVLFVPIYGQDDSTDAFCSLLRVEGVTILFDCGWTDKCDVTLLEPLRDVAPLVDLVRLGSCKRPCACMFSRWY